MPRPKGSKNKVAMIAAAPVDYAALIDEKQSAMQRLLLLQLISIL